jgi:hypothetical protein
MTLSTQLQERIAEIAEHWATNWYDNGKGELVGGWIMRAITQLATDPVFREELERPMQDTIDMMTGQLQFHREESDKLRERIAELEKKLQKALKTIDDLNQAYIDNNI